MSGAVRRPAVPEQCGTPPLKVAIVSPHPLTRNGLVRLLGAARERVRVVDAVDGPTWLPTADVLVVDFGSDGGDGSGTSALSPAHSYLAANRDRVVALVRHDQPAQRTTAEAIGVRVVVTDAASAAQLLAATEQAAIGSSTPAEDGGRASWDVDLSKRELEVLGLISTGMTNQQIADSLFLSINSVKTYIRTAYQKISVESRSNAVRWTVANGVAAAGP